MTRCACGADHEADHHRGMIAARDNRIERLGEAFETIDGPETADILAQLGGTPDDEVPEEDL